MGLKRMPGSGQRLVDKEHPALPGPACRCRVKRDGCQVTASRWYDLTVFQAGTMRRYLLNFSPEPPVLRSFNEIPGLLAFPPRRWRGHKLRRNTDELWPCPH